MKNLLFAFNTLFIGSCILCLTGCDSGEAHSVIEDASETELAEMQAMIDQSEQATQQSSADATKQPSNR
ncbi:hypothetical protein [Rhodopirellula sp. P2]|uniref:hypothetical protein n=1 Tax=Rhodopirellula sp. P2 TaxID=2127060 RepID=UPI002368142F|nr:hypothetical protein [Rhodopirellula sp. P2]WDQ14732.1 hypothetical protein PSR62_13880 [Rhodopirellula sp. P2]